MDSSRKQDADGLRFLLKNNSQSDALLNDYQSRARLSYLPAYVGSLGVALAVGGPIYADSLKSAEGRRDTRYAFLFSGLFLAVGSYVYGQLALSGKEKMLEKAVNTYNDAAPEAERIRVDLAPLPGGVGGEIKTQVPF